MWASGHFGGGHMWAAGHFGGGHMWAAGHFGGGHMFGAGRGIQCTTGAPIPHAVTGTRDAASTSARDGERVL